MVQDSEHVRVRSCPGFLPPRSRREREIEIEWNSIASGWRDRMTFGDSEMKGEIY